MILVCAKKIDISFVDIFIHIWYVKVFPWNLKIQVRISEFRNIIY